MPVLKKSERTPRLGTIKGGMEAVMVRATTGRRAGSRKGCKLSFKSSRNLIYHACGFKREALLELIKRSASFANVLGKQGFTIFCLRPGELEPSRQNWYCRRKPGKNMDVRFSYKKKQLICGLSLHPKSFAHHWGGILWSGVGLVNERSGKRHCVFALHETNAVKSYFLVPTKSSKK